MANHILNEGLRVLDELVCDASNSNSLQTPFGRGVGEGVGAVFDGDGDPADLDAIRTLIEPLAAYIAQAKDPRETLNQVESLLEAKVTGRHK